MNQPDKMKGLSSLRLDPQEKKAAGSRQRVVMVGLAVVMLFGGLTALAIMTSRSADSGDSSSAAERSREPLPAEQPRRTTSSGREKVAAGGYVEARRSAILQPGREGVVETVHVALGQGVKQGELLLELENHADKAGESMAEAELALAGTRLRAVRAGSRIEEVQAASSDVEAAEAAFTEARQELERLETLVPQGAVTAAEVDRTRQRARAAEARLAALQARERMVRRGNLPTDVAAAKAQEERATAALERAQALLELTRLRAPFDGVILSLDVEPGEVISLQSPREIMTLADITELWVRADIPETRVAQVKLGAAAQIVVDALGEQRLDGEVVEIAPLADRQSNTVSVAIRVVEPPEQLRPNMSARVFIRSREE